MKCYFAGSSNPYEYPFVDACFARSSKEAKPFMWKNSYRLSDECDGEYTNLRVVREKTGDQYFDQSKTEPYIIRDNKVLRLMGWSYEGETACDACGLYANEMDEFAVCGMCGQCKECGFSDGCEEHDED